MGDFGSAHANLSFDQAFEALRGGAKVRRAIWERCIVASGDGAAWDYRDEEWASLGVGKDKTYFPNPIDTEACDWIIATYVEPRRKRVAA